MNVSKGLQEMASIVQVSFVSIFHLLLIGEQSEPTLFMITG